MLTLTTHSELRTFVKQLRTHAYSQFHQLAFVPTMGNLHEGHLQLVKEALKVADKVIVSIFVNPLQFGVNEDFDKYPRTLEQDLALLSTVKTTAVFTPTVQTLYPLPLEQSTTVEEPSLTQTLCGLSRPTHFKGVTTIVTKLFNLVQPDIAFFGLKDYQQYCVIKKMATDLFMPLEIVGVPTVRENDGLAKSSRNGYLTTEQRQIAPALFKQLSMIQQALKQGQRNFTALETAAAQALTNAGFKPDYIAIRQAETLAIPKATENNFVILAAAYLGKTRLIDNLICSV